MVSLAIQAVHDDAQSYVNPGLRAMTGCPLWVKSRHMQCTTAWLRAVAKDRPVGMIHFDAQ